MTENEYLHYFNLRIKFNKVLREYISKNLLEKKEELDNSAVMHAFVNTENGPAICVEYTVKKRIKPKHALIPLGEFEEKVFGKAIV